MQPLKKFFQSLISPKIPVTNVTDNFTVARLQFAEGWGLASFNSGYDHFAHRSSFPWMVLVELTVNEGNENGHPTGEEAVELKNIEDRVNQFLAQKHTVHFVARITKPNMRELIYYIDHPKWTEAELTVFCDTIQEQREMNFTTEKDPNWKGVSGFIK